MPQLVVGHRRHGVVRPGRRQQVVGQIVGVAYGPVGGRRHRLAYAQQSPQFVGLVDEVPAVAVGHLASATQNGRGRDRAVVTGLGQLLAQYVIGVDHFSLRVALKV